MNDVAARVEAVDVDGVEVIFIRVTGLDTRGILDVLGDAAREIRSHSPASARILADLTGSSIGLEADDGTYDRRLVEGIKSYLIRNEPFVLATAIVVPPEDGSRELIALLEQLSGRRFELFGSTEAAMAWIVRQ